MAEGDTFKHGQIPITGVAQQLTTIASNSSSLLLKNPGATNTIYIGNSNAVTSGTGFPIKPGETLTLAVLSGRKLWAIGTAADVLAWASVSA